VPRVCHSAARSCTKSPRKRPSLAGLALAHALGMSMTLRRSLFVALWVGVPLACGGQSEQSLPGSAAAGAASVSSAAAGHSSTAGPVSSSGGRGSSSGGAIGSTGGAIGSTGGAIGSTGGAIGSSGGTAGSNSSMSGGGPLYIGCCSAFRGCPIGETQLSGPNACVSPDTCHEMMSCCGQSAACCIAFWCDVIPDAGAGEAGASNAGASGASGASASDAGAGGAAGD
jgi:hypothetical protein